MKGFVILLATLAVLVGIYVDKEKVSLKTENVFVAYVGGNEYVINNIDDITTKGDFFIMKTSDNRQIRLYQVGNTTIKLVEQKLQRENGVVVETEGVVHVK